MFNFFYYFYLRSPLIMDNSNKEQKVKSKIFLSPTSKAKILTPIKSALQKSNRNTFKFLKEIQNIVDNTNKENMKDWEF